MKHQSLDEAIAVVSAGCIFPGAGNVKEFWDNCRNQKKSIEPLSSERWDIDHYYSPDRRDEDGIYSRLAAEISKKTYLDIIKDFDLPPTTNRLEAYVTHALSQIFSNKLKKTDPSKTGFVLGMMNPDEEFNHGLMQLCHDEILDALRKETDAENREKVILELEKIISREHNDILTSRDRYFSSDILDRVARRFELNGFTTIVDAACASSLCSLDIGVTLLRHKTLDSVVVGGVESNLSPGIYTVFSRVGALATNQSLPFDENTEGLVQGEGAGLFLLKRYEDAVRDGDTILTTIVGSDGSSDGKTSSLFQPNALGQARSYSRVHNNLGTESLAYLEAHGTGTPTGDRAELSSIQTYFKEMSFPVGSVKSLIGHTKGAAGAAGLLKAIFTINEGLVPGSPYISKPLTDGEDGIFLNQSSLKLSEMDKEKMVGVSGFGFGGTNYHVAIKSTPDTLRMPQPLEEKDKWQDVVCCAEHEIELKDFDANWFMSSESPYRLPVQVIDRIDKVQLLAVQATYEALSRAGISLDFLPTKDIMVISASVLGLDICYDIAGRLQVVHLMGLVKSSEDYHSNPGLQTLWASLDNIKSHFPSCKEDHGPGLLNNVIAGRVCNAFDFKGKSYNIEHGVESKTYAMYLAARELQLYRSPFVVVVYANEIEEEGAQKIQRLSVGCKLLSLSSTAQEYFIRPLSRLKIDDI